jgi:hypothetical protein
MRSATLVALVLAPRLQSMLEGPYARCLRGPVTAGLLDRARRHVGTGIDGCELDKRQHLDNRDRRRLGGPG